MPFVIQSKGNKYQVVDTSSGEVKAASGSKVKAERQLKILRSLEKGWRNEGDGTFTRTVNGKKVTLRVTGGSKNGSVSRGKSDTGSVEQESAGT
jgi:hypothetical protein